MVCANAVAVGGRMADRATAFAKFEVNRPHMMQANEMRRHCGRRRHKDATKAFEQPSSGLPPAEIENEDGVCTTGGIAAELVPRPEKSV